MESKIMENDDRIDKKELITRFFSSFMFVPFIFMMLFVSDKVFSLFCFVTFAIIVFEIFSLRIKAKYFVRYFTAAVCFVGLLSFLYVRSNFGALGCIFLVCISSFSDIGAYFSGKLIGGPKLCTKISPHKTWAGLFGGIVFSNLCIFLMRDVFFKPTIGGSFLPSYIGDFFSVQAVILAAIIGDLLESFFKRKIGVKDMGNLFPGHGGILDRLDSLIFAAIVFTIINILL